ncbi:MAG: assimilatory sulfite reductase (NADPH) flavoprotein subunit [Thalassotalea sp.]|nr:assimilatory sulfite reductase (NADPH) flavoprotein subunit [Thalassotalea sp.]
MLVKANTDSSASLNTEQLQQLQQVSQQFTPLQLAWASGYLAAKSENVGNPANIQAESSASAKLTILYGSQTGNAKAVASQVEAAASSAGIKVSTFNMADYKGKNLKNESHVLIITSTNGEGEPPDDAIALHEFLGSKRAPKLSNLNYSVLALGDSSYEFFCQTGKDFDEMLSKLGAKAFSPRIDCDLDYQQNVKDWQEIVLKEAASQLKATTADVVQLPVDNASQNQTSQYSKENPFTATILANQKITGRDSNKVVQHIEIDLADSGITYQPGDALGIFPVNDKALVAEIVKLLTLELSQNVLLNEQDISLEQALTSELEITKLNKASILAWAELANNDELTALLSDSEQLRELINTVQFIDFAKQYPAQVSAQQLASTLAAITPRLYSIASSQADVEEEVHLTVGLVEYEVDNQQRLGCASGFLIERLQEDDEVKVFIEHNNNFRLPANPETAAIMIGPGTGVAPFRAFVQQRSADEASGKNWLFFGDQTFTQDFLYQVEWQSYLKSGELSRLDVAFSRDQAQKIYVQDKLKAQGSDVFAWLESGAHLYICGDMQRMAKDVHQALVEIISEHGAKTLAQAEDYLKQLRINKRYQKDVY